MMPPAKATVAMVTATEASVVPVVVPMIPSHVGVVVSLHAVLLPTAVVVVVVAVVVVPTAVAVVDHDDAAAASAVHARHHAHVHSHHCAHHHASHHGATTAHTLPRRRVGVTVTILRIRVRVDNSRDDGRCRSSSLRGWLHHRLTVRTNDWTAVRSQNRDHRRRCLRSLGDHHDLAVRTNDWATVWPYLLHHHRRCLWWHRRRHHERLTINAKNGLAIRSQLRNHLRLRWGHHGLLGRLNLLSSGSLVVLLLYKSYFSLILLVLIPHFLRWGLVGHHNIQNLNQVTAEGARHVADANTGDVWLQDRSFGFG